MPENHCLIITKDMHIFLSPIAASAACNAELTESLTCLHGRHWIAGCEGGFSRAPLLTSGVLRRPIYRRVWLAERIATAAARSESRIVGDAIALPSPRKGVASPTQLLTSSRRSSAKELLRQSRSPIHRVAGGGGKSVLSLVATSTRAFLGGQNGCIGIWDLGTYVEISSLAGHRSNVLALALAQSNSCLAR